MIPSGASVNIDELRFSVSDEDIKTHTVPEKAAMEAIATAIGRKLGENSSVDVSKQGGRYVLKIAQPSARLSEILPSDISTWISTAAPLRGSVKSFILVVPHSVMANSTNGK